MHLLWGLLAGALFGGLSSGIFGALVGAFAGFLAAVVYDSYRRKHGDRVATLEARVAALEARLRGEAPAPEMAPPVAAPPVAPKPLPAAPIPVPAKPERTTPPPIPAPPNALIAWITGGNAIARVGVVVLFVGIAFLLRYAIEESLLSAQLRTAGVGAGGLVLLALGWRMRESRPGYALSLLGAGVGLLYFTVFGAFRLYQLIPASVAFPLMVVVAVLATALAVRLDSAVLAGFGAAGGFLAPVLASTGGGDPVTLFGFYAVLNLAILATAWFRSWRSLNILGFVFTFGIGLAWGYEYYQPEYFDTTEPFLVFFFALYVAVAILFARGAASTTGRFVDGTIVFGVPIVAFGLQAALLRDTEYGLAISSVVVSLVYAVLAGVLYTRGREEWRLLARSFAALGVVFATIAIPLSLDARWTSAAWALEGAAVVWVSSRQGGRLGLAFGVALQFLAGIAFIRVFADMPRAVPLANAAYVGALLIAASGLAVHGFVRAAAPRTAKVLFVWALAWWFAGGFKEIDHFVHGRAALDAALVLTAGTALVFAFFSRRLAWTEAGWPSAWLAPVLFAFLFARWAFSATHPFAGWGWAAWSLALIAHLAARRAIEGPAPRAGAYWSLHHWTVLPLLALLGTWEAHWLIMHSGLRTTGWASPLLVLVPSVLVAGVSLRATMRHWPVLAHPRAYIRTGAWPLVAALFAWTFAANWLHSGRSEPLVYLPIFNSVDLAQLVAAAAVLLWARGLAMRGLSRPWPFAGPGLAILSGLAAWAWANGVLLRSLHHWGGVPYNLEAWARSFLAQAALSIFWTVLALALMVIATRTARRTLWVSGAALMAVVVVKLALIDSARLDGVERIASFIGVGLLMLTIGYFAPVPPRVAGGR